MKHELQKMIDRTVGTEGVLRIPSWWMHKILSDLVQYCDSLESSDAGIKEYLESQLKLVGNAVKASDARVTEVKSELLSRIATLEALKHPDLSTQPGILPYRFMGNYVIEQLIPVTLSNVDFDFSSGKKTILVRETLIYSKPFILEARLIAEKHSLSVETSYDGAFGDGVGALFFESQWGEWEYHVKDGKPLFLRIVYTTLEQDSSYEY